MSCKIVQIPMKAKMTQHVYYIQKVGDPILYFVLLQIAQFKTVQM